MRQIIISLLLLSSSLVNAQEKVTEYKPQVHLGFGLGIDYGGLPGGSLMYSPLRKVSFFSGIGNGFVGVSYCAGIKLKGSFGNNQGVVPFVSGMYGTNAVVRIVDPRPLSRIFSGVTVGAGLEIHLRPTSGNHFSCTVLFPIRKPAVGEYLDFLETRYGMIYTSKLSPVLLSIGYQYAF